jgi:hypothetical protein
VLAVRVVAPAFLDGHPEAVAHDQAALSADAADIGRLQRPRAQLTKRFEIQRLCVRATAPTRSKADATDDGFCGGKSEPISPRPPIPPTAQSRWCPWAH